MDEENDDEIIIGVNIPKISNQKKKSKKKKTKNKNFKNKVEVVKNTTSKNKLKIKKNSKFLKNIFLSKLSIIILLLIASMIFLASSFFDIKNIIVENNNIVSKDEIISLSQIKTGKNIFAFSKRDPINGIKQNSYIESVEIQRNFPNEVIINVKERPIKYMIQLGNAYVYIDNQGYILDISSNKKEVPIILGILTDLSSIEKGNRLIEDDLKRLDVANRINETAKNNDINSLITKIDISDSKNYTIYLENENKIAYLGDCSDINTRILFVKAITEQEQGIEGEIFVNVDLNNDNVYFRQKI